MYDAWDKQQCLVPVSDWKHRALSRACYQPWHDRGVLDEYPDVAATALRELDARGPLSSLEFTERRQARGGHSWYGSSLIKRVLRALWARGDLVTHHRQAGRHYYDRAERVIPPEYFLAQQFTDEAEYHRWIVQRRHQAAGLLRPTASAEVWCACGAAADRAQAVVELVERGALLPIRVGERSILYHLHSSALPFLEKATPEHRMVFLAPLDNLLWDRKTIELLFGYRYLWEVYKPEAARLWGYYVLPVLYGDRLVGRFDSRVSAGVWQISRWWWEDGVERDADFYRALHSATTLFMGYLGVDGLQVDPSVDRTTSEILTAAQS